MKYRYNGQCYHSYDEENRLSAEFAGAVEAAASTGGQIMPPIMGATAFLMAEMCGVEYASIIQKAILPAFLYFSGIFPDGSF